MRLKENGKVSVQLSMQEDGGKRKDPTAVAYVHLMFYMNKYFWGATRNLRTNSPLAYDAGIFWF